MSRPRDGSQRPDDEVMPYSDDETDDELDDELAVSTDEDVEEPPGAPHAPSEARPSGETQRMTHSMTQRLHLSPAM